MSFFTGGVLSEVSLFHPDYILWFVSIDETNHKFSTDGPKGGPATQHHHNRSFNRCGDLVVKSNRHTTGVYATNPFEALPLLYICDTKAKKEKNYKIDPLWCKGLPVIEGKYGTGRMQTWPSQVPMQPKGSMDQWLLPMYI